MPERSSIVDENSQGVRVTDAFDDQTPGRMIYNPGHPHAKSEIVDANFDGLEKWLI